MCWRIIKHTLNCDVRPFIYDGMYQKFIDPFVAPIPCNCPAQHQTWIQCPDHGCCILTKENVPCSQPGCTQIYELHRYQRPPRYQPVWGVNPVFYTQPGDPWENVEYLDVAIFSTKNPPQLTAFTNEFVELLNNLIQKGREINFTHKQLMQVLTEAEDQRQLHASQHGILCNSPNWNCPINQAIQNAEQATASLQSEGQALSAEFRQLWTEVNVKVVRQMVMVQIDEILKLRGLL